MKICLINNLYKPYNRGGAEKITETIANGLLKAGHEVFIITTKPHGELRITNYLPAGKAGELRIYYLNSLYHNLNRLPKFLRLFWHIWDVFNIISYFKVKRILKKEKCEAVITNNLMGLGFLIPLAIRRLKINHLHIVHDIQLIHPAGLLFFGRENIINSYFSRNYAGLCAQLFASPRAVIFPSRWLRDRYLDKIFFIKSKRIVLPNPATPPLNLPPASPAGGLIKGENESVNDGSFKFLYLGQIEKHKGLDLLIQAFKKVKEEFPRVELIIAGAGSELEKIKLEAGQDENIKFLGWQNETEVNRLLSACQGLVMPTLCYENCPTVILEAFGAGLPVIAADLGGISELIGETTGILFRPGNPVDLADKMAWAIDHKSDLAEIAKTGREKAALCSVENYINELEGLIKL